MYAYFLGRGKRGDERSSEVPPFSSQNTCGRREDFSKIPFHLRKDMFFMSCYASQTTPFSRRIEGYYFPISTTICCTAFCRSHNISQATLFYWPLQILHNNGLTWRIGSYAAQCPREYTCCMQRTILYVLYLQSQQVPEVQGSFGERKN